MKKHRSSVYRELVPNSCESGYFPETAQLLATELGTESIGMIRLNRNNSKHLDPQTTNDKKTLSAFISE